MRLVAAHARSSQTESQDLPRLIRNSTACRPASSEPATASGYRLPIGYSSTVANISPHYSGSPRRAQRSEQELSIRTAGRIWEGMQFWMIGWESRCPCIRGIWRESKVPRHSLRSLARSRAGSCIVCAYTVIPHSLNWCHPRNTRRRQEDRKWVKVASASNRWRTGSRVFGRTVRAVRARSTWQLPGGRGRSLGKAVTRVKERGLSRTGLRSLKRPGFPRAAKDGAGSSAV